MLALTGDLVVPTLIAGDKMVVGFDQAALAEITAQPAEASAKAARTANPPAESAHAAALPDEAAQAPDPQAERVLAPSDEAAQTPEPPAEVVQPAADLTAEAAARPVEAADSPSGEQAAAPPGNSLQTDQGHRVIASGATLSDDLTNLLARIGSELDYNAAKGSTPFRLGMHDGLRFAQDAVADLLTRHGHTPEVPDCIWDV